MTQQQYYSIPQQVTGYPILPDSVTVILPEESTNLVLNPSVETNMTGYTALGGATAIARVISHQRRGVYGIEVTPAAGVDAGVYNNGTTTVTGTVYTLSLDFLGVIGDTYRLRIYTNAGVVVAQSDIIDGKDFWQRPYFTYTETAGGANQRLAVMRLNGGSVIPFYVDGFQLEALDHNTTYIDGDQAPITPGRQEYFWNGVVHASTSYRIQDTRAGGREVTLNSLGFEVMSIVGWGHPTISNISTEMNLGGSSYQNTIVKERLITVSGSFQANDFRDLMKKRAAVLDAVSPFKTTQKQPLKLGYHSMQGCEDVKPPVYFQVSYESGLEGIIDNPASENVGIVFKEYLPGGFEDGERAIELMPFELIEGSLLFMRQDKNSGEWINAGGSFETNATEEIYAIAESQNKTMYIGGLFVGNILEFNQDTLASSTLGAGGNNTVYTIFIAKNGLVYMGGDFTSMNAAAHTRISVYDPVSATFATFGTGMNSTVRSIIVTKNNLICAGGAFTTANGVAVNYFTYWDATAATFVAIGAGLNGIVYDMWLDNDGTTIWIAGAFTTANGVAANTVCRFNSLTLAFETGYATGLANTLSNSICETVNGDVYCLHNTTVTNGVPYKLDGQSWVSVPNFPFVTSNKIRPHKYDSGVYINRTTTVDDTEAFTNYINGAFYETQEHGLSGISCTSIYETDKYIYLGLSKLVLTIYLMSVSAFTDVGISDYEKAIPNYKIFGPAVVKYISNQVANKKIYMNYVLGDGEYVNINLLNSSIIDSNGNNKIGELLPISQFSNFDFSSEYPRSGIYIFYGAAVYNDANGQIDPYGISTPGFSASDDYVLYAKITKPGMIYYLELYDDAARTNIVAISSGYTAPDIQDITELFGSGYNGWVNLPGASAVDSDIEIHFGHAHMLWSPMYRSIDEVL
jgi:hypothetical protein